MDPVGGGGAPPMDHLPQVQLIPGVKVLRIGCYLDCNALSEYAASTSPAAVLCGNQVIYKHP